MTLFCCSLMINETQLQEIREARNKMRFPQTLVDLAIKTVAKHCSTALASLTIFPTIL
jgi:hypothetical protein